MFHQFVNALNNLDTAGMSPAERARVLNYRKNGVPGSSILSWLVQHPVLVRAIIGDLSQVATDNDNTKEMENRKERER